MACLIRWSDEIVGYMMLTGFPSNQLHLYKAIHEELLYESPILPLDISPGFIAGEFTKLRISSSRPSN